MATSRLPGHIAGTSALRPNVANLETVHLGKSLHFLQEDHPHAIGENVARWFQEMVRPPFLGR